MATAEVVSALLRILQADDGPPLLAVESLVERILALLHPLKDTSSTPGAIGNELIPWALGTGDPVRDRVEALQREEAE